MHGNSMHGNQEIPVLPAAPRKRRAGGGTHKGNTFMYGAGKSDCCVVPGKVPNKGNRGGAGGKAADQGERNGGTHGPAPYRKSVSQGLYGVRKTDVVFRYSSKIRAVC